MGSFQFRCGHCQSVLNAKPEHVGKSLACPKCQQPVTVPPAPDPLAPTPVPATPVTPTPVTLAEAVTEPAAVDPLAPSAGVTPAAQPAMQLCPHCHSHIPAQASKCRYCGEFIAPQKSARDRSAKMSVLDFLVAILLPPVGLGLGIVWAGQKLTKARTMLLVSGPLTVLVLIGIVVGTIYLPGTTWKNTEIQPMSFEDFSGAPDDGEGMGPDGETPEEREEPSMMRPPEESVLNEQPEVIQRAMRANVRLLIQTHLGTMFGSGVIVEVKDQQALIITNRHVIDPTFAESRGDYGMELDSLPEVEVMFVSGAKQTGEVIWLSPDKVDLALVRVACEDDKVRVADCKLFPAITHGESVFAVGNPIGLGWSLTRGTVSAIRQHDIGEREIPVIQTDTAINRGNSGGGLYNAQGQLIGINDFIVSQEYAQRVGFAIRYSLLKELNPEQFGSAE